MFKVAVIGGGSTSGNGNGETSPGGLGPCQQARFAPAMGTWRA